MTDFLLELRSEEIPARMQDKARADLARLFGDELAKAGLKVEAVETYATPRRLALIARGIPLETAAASEETKGPKTSAPPQALEGFLRKTGLTQDQLEERDGVYFAVIEKPGRKTRTVLYEAIPYIIEQFPWPKSMRWGRASKTTESLRWVRPLQGVVALLGDEIVPAKIKLETVSNRQGNVVVIDQDAAEVIIAGSTTTGHRFHHSGVITIGNAADYAMKLRAAHVIIDQEERRAIIRNGAEKAASAAGLVLVPDEGLVAENAGLTEWPVPMLGRFDPAFLDVPEEVIQLTARVNQKYFICRDSAGKLANAFICTANLEPSDGGATVIAGNEKVLAARLSDAKFFWEQDLKVSLEDQAAKLSQIVFHEKLYPLSVVAQLISAYSALWFELGILQGDGQKAALAGALAKADLTTGMVGEFPELQGIMGGYYAADQFQDADLANAIRDHYKPQGPSDSVPTQPLSVAVALSDKLHQLSAFMAVGEFPTGSKDPYGLRRSALGIIRLILTNSMRVQLRPVIAQFIKLIPRIHGVFLRASDPDFDKIVSMIWPEFPVDLQPGLVGPRLAKLKLENPTLYPIAIETLKSKLNPLFELNAKTEATTSIVLNFLADRLKVQQREAGVRHDLIDAVFALGGEDDLVRLLARVKALQAFVGTDAGVNLLAGYKRAGNILKSSPARGGGGEADGGVPSSGQSGAGGNLGPLRPVGAPPRAGEELAMESALDTAEPLATSAIAAEDFEGAMSALSTLRAPIDAFFEGVMVNDPDPHKRAYRLGLLERFVSAVHRVADFSKIEG
jgi:glycyl-tRNA synthetase beta chain